MNDIIFNINGGNNQILPNATEAVQNFYGDQYAEKILGTSTPDSASIPELGKLSLYIDKVNLPGYISQIGECLNATEFARIVISIFEQESRLTEEEIVKDSKSKLQQLSKENKELKAKMKRMANSQNCYRLYNCKVTISPSLKRRKGKR